MNVLRFAILTRLIFLAAVAAEIPLALAPLFSPPRELSNRSGEFPSLLRFYDGTPVASAPDWEKRRNEIRFAWEKEIAKWPPLIEKPRIEILSTSNRIAFLQHRVRLEAARDLHIEGYLLVPPGSGPFPAVVVPYYEPESSVGLGKTKLRDFGSELARRGFVALAIGSPGGDARKPEMVGVDCQPLHFLGYIAANCYNALAGQTNVDATRIAVVGHSYGGKWAMFAACFYEKFAAGVWSDPGIAFDNTRANINYWEPWYLGADHGRNRTPGLPTEENPMTGAYKRLIEGGHDLNEVQSLMAPRPFLVSGGAEDGVERWLALNRINEVYALLGKTNRVAMSNRPGHDPTPESNEQIYAFLEYFLKTRR